MLVTFKHIADVSDIAAHNKSTKLTAKLKVDCRKVPEIYIKCRILLYIAVSQHLRNVLEEKLEVVYFKVGVEEHKAIIRVHKLGSAVEDKEHLDEDINAFKVIVVPLQMSVFSKNTIYYNSSDRSTLLDDVFGLLIEIIRIKEHIVFAVTVSFCLDTLIIYSEDPADIQDLTDLVKSASALRNESIRKALYCHHKALEHFPERTTLHR